ncbi:site-specific integrase [Lutibacter sp.]|uniref:site-specific integrase n=1 Tax=Lutibacter sp. TaxID=1925666 RepID=UPI0025C429A5|nr:site-specific integrase [Lutibacter sp.]
MYLNDDEINTIYNHDFKNDKKLDNARDLFIIGLRTGLRISDFLRLKQTNIKDGYIEIETQKTGQEVVIPMHPQVKEILKKRNGFPRQISDQKFNLYIKDVCEAAKLKEKVHGSKIDKETNRKKEGNYPKYELVTSHICRRSFASNLYGALPNMVIMGITGHTTETQFLRYIKITPKENANKLKEYWAKQKEENSYEQLNMKIVK